VGCPLTGAATGACAVHCSQLCWLLAGMLHRHSLLARRALQVTSQAGGQRYSPGACMCIRPFCRFPCADLGTDTCINIRGTSQPPMLVLNHTCLNTHPKTLTLTPHTQTHTPAHTRTCTRPRLRPHDSQGCIRGVLQLLAAPCAHCGWRGTQRRVGPAREYHGPPSVCKWAVGPCEVRSSCPAKAASE
jgi:hypothetical protein